MSHGCCCQPDACQPALADELTCMGQTATVVQHRGMIIGTPGDDVILLTGKGRVIARGGNNLVCGSPSAILQ
jgi:hypothetical protein